MKTNEAAKPLARPLRRGAFVSRKTAPHPFQHSFEPRAPDPISARPASGHRLSLDRSHEAGIAASSSRVDAGNALSRKAGHVMRAAGLGARA
jgi:hypothetical protein